MRAREIIASWLEAQHGRCLEGRRRCAWAPLGGWSRLDPQELDDWDRGYAQAHADLAELFREGLLSPGGRLYEGERLFLVGRRSAMERDGA